MLIDKDFEKHGFLVSSKDEVGATYERVIRETSFKFTYLTKHNLLLFSAAFEGNTVPLFNEFKVNEAFDLDFLIDRCWQYQAFLSCSFLTKMADTKNVKILTEDEVSEINHKIRLSFSSFYKELSDIEAQYGVSITKKPVQYCEMRHRTEKLGETTLIITDSLCESTN